MTPSRLDTLRLLVEDRHVSRYALNALQESMNGVTPLGYAAWRNSPEAVETLLEASGGARDGNLEVVDCLVSTVCILTPRGLRQF
jgi:hypothetical protein